MNESTRSVRQNADLTIRDQRWIWGERTLIMGIVNVTPDSFSGDGLMNHEQAVNHALHQIAAGADIIDIGGESTRPGFTTIEEHDELDRVLPVIKAVRETSQIPISIDTTKPAVFAAALDAGADVLNCIKGLPMELLAIASARAVPVVISHWQEHAVYESDVTSAVVSQLEHLAAVAMRHGVPRENIILDPGIGFGKTAEHNLQVLRDFSKLTGLGYPTLLGTSRKSFIGKITGSPPEQRAFGTAATVALAIAAGVDMVRVHDVAEIKQTAMIADAITRSWRPGDWATT